MNHATPIHYRLDAIDHFSFSFIRVIWMMPMPDAATRCLIMRYVRCYCRYFADDYCFMPDDYRYTITIIDMLAPPLDAAFKMIRLFF